MSGILNVLLGDNAPAGGSPTFSLDFVDHQEEATGGSPITYTALGFGAADTNRIVAVSICDRTNSTVDPIVSVTIGGVSATNAVAATRLDGNPFFGDIWYAAVPTGTSGDVVVTWTLGGPARSGVASYRIITATPTPTNTGFVVGIVNTESLAMTVPASGAAMAVYGLRNASVASFTWTNATKDYEAESPDAAAAYTSAKLTSSATVDVTGDVSGSLGDVLMYAAWGP